MLDGGFMGERLALKRSYGEIGWPKGFKPVKDHHRALVEFLELHKNEFAHISFGEMDDDDDLKRRIQKNKYGVCVVEDGFIGDRYYTLGKEEYFCSFQIIEIIDGLYWTLIEYDGFESVDYFKIKPGSYQLEKVM